MTRSHRLDLAVLLLAIAAIIAILAIAAAPRSAATTGAGMTPVRPSSGAPHLNGPWSAPGAASYVAVPLPSPLVAAAPATHAPSRFHRTYPPATQHARDWAWRGLGDREAASATAYGPWRHGISTFFSWQELGCGTYKAWSFSCATRGHFACGGHYLRMSLGVASRVLPCGTRVELRNPANGKRLVVRVVDRGPFTAGLDFDMTSETAIRLGHVYTGPLDWRVVK